MLVKIEEIDYLKNRWYKLTPEEFKYWDLLIHIYAWEKKQ